MNIIKKILFDVCFDTDDHYWWNLVPAGVTCDYETYEYHTGYKVYESGDINIENTTAIGECKSILDMFRKNVKGEEADIVYRVLSEAIDSDWSKSFEINNYDGHGNIHIKFYIDDHEERIPYTFYPTETQRSILDNVKYKISDEPGSYMNLNEQELNDAILEKLLDVWQKWLINDYKEEIDRGLED